MNNSYTHDEDNQQLMRSQKLEFHRIIKGVLTNTFRQHVVSKKKLFLATHKIISGKFATLYSLVQQHLTYSTILFKKKIKSVLFKEF